MTLELEDSSRPDRRTDPILRWLSAIVLGLAALASSLALVRIVKGSGSLGQLSVPVRVVLTILTTSSLGVAATTLAGLVRGSVARVRPVDLRVAFSLLVLGFFLCPAVVPRYSFGVTLLWYGCLSALYGVWLRVRLHRLRPRTLPGARFLDLGLFNLSLTVLLLQASLLAAAWIFPTSLLSLPGSVDRLLADSRCPPGTLRFGFPCNRLGYYDEELEQADGIQVSVVGDSFTLGIVPHPHLFTTVAERLTGFRIDSFGVARAGPPEYRLILEQDGLSADPDIVVIAAFVGNDISYSHQVRSRHQGHAWLRSWLDRDLNPLWVVAGRLYRLTRELSRGRTLAEIGEARGDVPPSGPLANSEYPWVVDYQLEQPTYAQTTFLELERGLAAAICDPELGGTYDAFFQDLEALAAISRGRTLAVMLIPDEFQVEDSLWDALTEGSPGWDRDLPQKLTTAWLQAHEIAMLDLLPAFRAQPAERDGRLHLYHRQDTHLNTRGNQIAGRELASLLKELSRGL